MTFSFDDIFTTSAGIVQEKAKESSSSLGGIVGGALGTLIAPGIGSVIGGTIGNTITRVISGAAFSRTPRLSWEQQNAIARPAADQIMENTLSSLKAKGIPDRVNDLIELLRKYAVARWKSLDFANRSNDTRTLAGRITNGEFRGDFNALTWGSLMIELDNVSTDKADAERRVAVVMNSIFKPAYEEFSRLIATSTEQDGGGFTVPGTEGEEETASKKNPLVTAAITVGGILLGRKLFGV